MASNQPRAGQHGLRTVADGIVSRIKTIRHNHNTRNGRGRKRPHNDNLKEVSRPETAAQGLHDRNDEETLRQGHRPQTAPDRTWSNATPMTLVETDLLKQVLCVLQSYEDIPRAEKECLNSSRELNTLKRRAEYLSYGTEEMKGWLEQRREGILQKATDPDAEAIEVDKVLAEYTSRIEALAKGLLDIDMQESSMEKGLDKAAEASKQLSGTVIDQLKGILGLAEGDVPVILKPDEYRHRLPIGLELLKEWEDDYEGFVEDEEPRQTSSKYPVRPTDDFYLHCGALELKRKAYDDAVEELKRLQSQQVQDGDIAAKIQSQDELVAARREAMAEAVEAVRLAGVPCKSDGSFIVNRADSDFAEINHDINVERRRQGTEEKAEEMTEQEVAEYLDRSRDITERWLTHVGLAQDPDKVGPKSPHTPGSAGFSERLLDVGVEDSISVASRSKEEKTGGVSP